MINDLELFALMKEKLYSAVICDILDEFDVRDNALEGSIRPLDNNTVLVGRSFTVLAAEVYAKAKEPYKLLIESIDSLSSEDVFVATTNGFSGAGFWGELLTNCAMERGARGAVIDGCARDIKQILELNFPLFVKGFNPLDSLGRVDVIAYQVPIKCGGVMVKPGDIIFADRDGIVIIPQGIEKEVVNKALEKVEEENLVRDEIKKGVSLGEVFKKHGIL
ncbi:MAG: RraA family protein [Dethiobacteria bacterium]